MMSIIVHGGAKEIPEHEQQEHLEGCAAAADAGWAVLESGGSAVEAVEAAIRKLEDLPIFNAGIGSELNADGEVQMDASIVEGSNLGTGAVAYIQRVRHPISVARQVLESEEVLIVGDGARHFAEEHFAELCTNEDLVTERSRAKWLEFKHSETRRRENNTVGCVARDNGGNIAAGASTGGTGGNRRGRVGDSPMVGCGTYADNGIGGCSMTGDGEHIARLVCAKVAVDLLASQAPGIAAREVIRRLESRLQGEGGCIVMNGRGEVDWHHNSEHMAVAYRCSGMSTSEPFIRKQDEVERAA